MEGKDLSKVDFLEEDEAMKRGPKAIQRVLDRLREKNMIKVAREDALLGKIYKAAVSYAEWIRAVLCEILNETPGEGVMCCVLDAFAEQDGKISGDMVKVMKEYLEAIET